MDFNYESPITKIEQEIASQIVETEEGKLMYEVKKAIGYSIEKEELIKALQYDREQYEKGYNDGYNANNMNLISKEKLLNKIDTYCKANCKYTEAEQDVMCRACMVDDIRDMVETAESEE